MHICSVVAYQISSLASPTYYSSSRLRLHGNWSGIRPFTYYILLLVSHACDTYAASRTNCTTISLLNKGRRTDYAGSMLGDAYSNAVHAKECAVARSTIPRHWPAHVSEKQAQRNTKNRRTAQTADASVPQTRHRGVGFWKS
jgi:hypothetical protein